MLALPSLERDPQEGVCSPRGVRSPDGELVAVCRGDETLIFYTADGGLRNGVRGCAPAWRPDGTLTLARNRQVVTERGELLIAGQELERAARLHPAVPDRTGRVRALVEGVAWAASGRAAVAISIRVGAPVDLGSVGTIAFFEDGRLADTRPYFRVTGGQLGASPRGTYVTQTPDVILRRDGSPVSLPRHLGVAQAFTWSPDERFLALATRYAVFVIDVASLERYDARGGGLRSVTIPQPAADVGWR